MADVITYDDFAKLELRVARVVEARPHPNADKLVLLQVESRSWPEYASITLQNNSWAS